jgi:shikimate 5-dehydrogenase
MAAEAWQRMYALLQQPTKQRLQGLDQLQVGHGGAARGAACSGAPVRGAERPPVTGIRVA